MAFRSGYPLIEEGNDSANGEMFRCVFNHTIDACLDQVVMPVGGVCYWDFLRLLADFRPWGVTGPAPAAPRAALNAAELYAALTGFPLGGHQDNMGSVEYAAIGVHQYETAVQAALTKIGMPAGICVINNLAGAPNAMSSHWPSEFLQATPATFLDKLYMIKTRGIVQARVDALCTNTAVGNYLETAGAGSWELIVDAANANEGTFIALEVAAIDNTMIWVMCVNVVY